MSENRMTREQASELLSNLVGFKWYPESVKYHDLLIAEYVASLRRELEVAKKEIREQQLRLAVQNDIINGNNLMLDEAERRTLLRAIRGAVDSAEDTENENVALRRKAKALDKLKELLKTRCLSSWTSDSGEYFIDTDRGEYYQGNDLLSALESKEGK